LCVYYHFVDVDIKILTILLKGMFFILAEICNSLFKTFCICFISFIAIEMILLADFVIVLLK
ncbi:hypothetical protein, partial [Staphylococcus epidermidis]